MCMWCLGNEMDGPWQIGHKVAQEYGWLANEMAKAVKPLGKNVETIVCGSSNDAMPTYPDWEREVLEECYENVEYISPHKYFGNNSRDTLKYFGKVEETGRYIQAIGGVIDLRQGEEAGHERRLYLLRRVKRLVPQSRGGIRRSGGAGTGPRRRRSLRRTTTSRTRSSSAACSRSSFAGATG